MNDDTFLIQCYGCMETSLLKNHDESTSEISLDLLPGNVIKIKCTTCSNKVFIEKDPLK